VFASSAEHDEYVLSEIEKLNKRDILFILGDFLFDGVNYDAYMDRLKKAKCRIKLVMGNHDSTKLYKESRFEMQLPFFTFKNMVWGGKMESELVEDRNGTIQSRTVIGSGYSNHDSC
jgi:calcineurin-like phosphoesterase family protein